MQKNYYAIIPANVRYDKSLKDKAKLLYGEITALCNQKGYCWASNEYFAELYGVSKTTISSLIKNLIEKGYIHSQIIYKEGTKQILHRYLKIVKYPIQENLKDNNTSNTTYNTKDNNIYNINTFKNFENFENLIGNNNRQGGVNNAKLPTDKLDRKNKPNEIKKGQYGIYL